MSEAHMTSKTKKAEQTALIGIAIAAVLGLIFAFLGASGGESIGPIKSFTLLVVLAFAINIAVFIPSYAARTDHYYDLTGSITYLTVTAIALLTTDELDTRTLLAALMIFVWAGRLGTFLFKRVKKSDGDRRFDQIKQSAVRFLMAWMLQGLWVTLTAGAAYAAMTSGSKTSFGILGVIGLAVWLVGFAIEAVSDSQKTAFKNDPANDGKFINVGLWRWSRHPNYFGEIMLWTGMAIMVLPALSGLQYATLISPIFVFVLLTRVSGVPMLERRADKKWGGQADYEQYKQDTPVLMMSPPS